MEIQEYIKNCYVVFHEYAYKIGDAKECKEIETVLQDDPILLAICKEHAYANLEGGKELEK